MLVLDVVSWWSIRGEMCGGGGASAAISSGSKDVTGFCDLFSRDVLKVGVFEGGGVFEAVA
jgi:hypothetical protein